MLGRDRAWMGRTVRRAALVTVAYSGVLVCSLTAAVFPARSAPHLTVAHSTVSPSVVPAWIAAEVGLFQKYGVDVELVYIPSGTTVQQAQVAGQVDLSLNSAGPVMTSVATGQRFHIIATFMDGLADEIVVNPSIHSAADLKGQKVGIGRFGAAADILMRAALSKLGVDPQRDVTFVQLGDESVRLAALLSGSVLATLIEAPQTRMAHERGYPTLARLQDLGIRYLKLGLVARPEMLGARRQETLAFLKAVVEAVKVLKTAPDVAVRVMAKRLDTSTDAARAIYDSYARLYPEKPYVNESSLEIARVVEGQRNPALRGFDVSQMVDNSLVRELDSSGFIEQLYR